MTTTNIEVQALQQQVKQIESELLGMKIFMSECGVYEAWSDQKDNYVVEEK